MSVNISAKEVNELRQKTGSGMMDCKKALVEAGGDFDKAIDILDEACVNVKLRSVETSPILAKRQKQLDEFVNITEFTL